MVLFKSFLKTVFLAVICIIAFSVVSGSAQINNSDSMRIIKTMGSHAITDENVAYSRKKAISKCLTSAMEQVIANIVPTKSLVLSFNDLNEVLYEKGNNFAWNNFIQDYKVLAEAEYDKVYRVIVQVTISVDKVKEHLAHSGIMLSTKPLPRILFLIAEQGVEDPSEKFWWGKGMFKVKSLAENEMTRLMHKKGFPVIDRRNKIIKKKIKENNILSDPDIDNTSVVLLGRSCQAQVVIAGDSFAELVPVTGTGDEEGRNSYSGTVSIRALRTDTGSEIASVIRSETTGHTNTAAGSADALVKAGSKAVNDLIPHIIAGWQGEDKASLPIEIKVEGTKHLAYFVMFRRILSEMPDVKEITTQERKADEAIIIADYRGSGQELAEALVLEKIDNFSISINEVSQKSIKLAIVPN